MGEVGGSIPFRAYHLACRPAKNHNLITSEQLIGLILEHLRAIRGGIAEVKTDLVEIRQRLGLIVAQYPDLPAGSTGGPETWCRSSVGSASSKSELPHYRPRLLAGVGSAIDFEARRSRNRFCSEEFPWWTMFTGGQFHEDTPITHRGGSPCTAGI